MQWKGCVADTREDKSEWIVVHKQTTEEGQTGFVRLNKADASHMRSFELLTLIVDTIDWEWATASQLKWQTDWEIIHLPMRTYLGGMHLSTNNPEKLWIFVT